LKTEGEQRAWEALPGELADKLLAALRKQTQAPGLAYAEPPAPLGGGLWASLYAFRLAGAPQELSGELVLRVMPASDQEARREAGVQAAALAAGFPAARVHFCGRRGAGLGFPYIVMDRMAGATLRDVSWGEKPRLAGKMPVLLAETLAHLHSLDLTPFARSLRRGRQPGSAGIMAVLRDLGERIQLLAADGYAAGLAWLRAQRAAPARRAVCHGDFHPLNLMIAEGRVSAVLDWSHALLAEPEYDIAYAAQLLAWWPLEVPLLPRSVAKHMFGQAAARQFITAYRRRSPVDADRLRWHEALHAYRVLVRVARARAGITLPPLSPEHPWELVASDAVAAFKARTGIEVVLPPR
jgi:aminoglycoside phosphotransferase (APT) family kinase protein